MRGSPNEHLAGETSPYVLQHAENPVDWYPWGPAAFARARSHDKPIFLSVGYAACHWCHVMAHESFEDPETAAALNEHFVAIKVDREERPDVDAIYMDAVQAMTGAGGWPMSVFLTPEGEPFYAGTYFPDTPRHGLPSFRQVLDGIVDAWAERRSDVAEQGARVTEAIVRTVPVGSSAPLDLSAIPDVAADALEILRRSFDAAWGGFGGAPKFPQASLLRWLLDRAARGDANARDMLTGTLDAMAAGGIHDHVGGGFARYSTDASWHVPHFEKMLYDNAQLLGIYAHAAVTTGNRGYRRVATRIGEWLLRELQQPEGGFSSSLDADSDGVEGAFYVWAWDELISVVGEPVARSLGARREGNWEGTNVLWLAREDGPAPAAAIDVLSDEDLESGLAALLGRRGSRVRPATDDKVVAAWNGLAIASLAIAGAALGERAFTDAAERCATFVWERMRDSDGRLQRSWRAGSGRVAGFADDYASVGLGFAMLYERTGRTVWLLRARALADAMIELFVDPHGGFFQVGSDVDPLVVRKLDLADEPTPSGTSAAAELLLRVGRYWGEARYEDEALHALERLLPICERAPSAAGQALRALELAAGPTAEVAIVGAAADPATGDLLDAVVDGQRYLPNAFVAPADPADPSAAEVPLFAGRLEVERPTAFVCQRFACRLPVTSPTDLVDSVSATLGSA